MVARLKKWQDKVMQVVWWYHDLVLHAMWLWWKYQNVMTWFCIPCGLWWKYENRLIPCGYYGERMKFVQCLPIQSSSPSWESLNVYSFFFFNFDYLLKSSTMSNERESIKAFKDTDYGRKSMTRRFHWLWKGTCSY